MSEFDLDEAKRCFAGEGSVEMAVQLGKAIVEIERLRAIVDPLERLTDDGCVVTISCPSQWGYSMVRAHGRTFSGRLLADALAEAARVCAGEKSEVPPDTQTR